MKHRTKTSALSVLAILVGSAALSAQTATVTQGGDSSSSIGVGMNYWVSLNDIDIDDIDDNGFSYLVSYQYRPGFLGFELVGEYFPDRFGDDAWAPEAYVIVGEGLYGAAGIGVVNSGGSFEDEPFFALKLGFDVKVIANLRLDVSANYRFNDTAELDDDDTKIDSDTVFLGATLRLGF